MILELPITGSKLIKGPDGQMYDENFIKTIVLADLKYARDRRRRKFLKGCLK